MTDPGNRTTEVFSHAAVPDDWRNISISLIDKFPGANGFRDEGKVNTEGAWGYGSLSRMTVPVDRALERSFMSLQVFKATSSLARSLA